MVRSFDSQENSKAYEAEWRYKLKASKKRLWPKLSRRNRMDFKKGFLLGLLLAFTLTGCTLHQKIGPAHDETLLYPLAYDLTYLRTLDAVQSVPDWELEETDKEKGLITVKNINYTRLTDADLRIVTFQIKRVGRKQTSIQITPDTQRTLGAGDLLDRIAQYVNREIKSPV
jgi:hypothetical protein